MPDRTSPADAPLAGTARVRSGTDARLPGGYPAAMEPMPSSVDPPAAAARRALAIAADAGLGVALMLAVPCVILLLFLPFAAGVRLLIELLKRL
jgi:hypothetical protein